MTEKPSKSPPLSFKTRVVVSALSLVTDLSRRRDGTIKRRLLNFLDLTAPPSPCPSRGVRSADLTVDPTRNLWFRLFVPTAADDENLPVIVFFHGGGFAFLSAATRAYDAVCRRLARKLRAAVASVNYRLSPEHRWPAPYDDGADVLRYLDRTAAADPDLNHLDLSNCFLMGDSAGGNIAHHVARRWAASEWDRVRLRGLVLIQPYFGGEERTDAEIRLPAAPIVSVERTDWLWRAFLPAGADRDHEAANVFGPRDDGGRSLGERWPATMVVVGGWDPLQDWQRRHAEGLRERGKEVRLVEYPEAIHAFYIFPEVKESGLVIEEIRGFMEAHMRRGD